LTERIPLAEAIQKYEDLRIPRTTKIVNAATGQQYWYHLKDGKAQEDRDAMFARKDSFENDPFLWREPVFAQFLYGYDAYAEAQKAAGKAGAYANGLSN
jgi:salicylate hydroxylase